MIKHTTSKDDGRKRYLNKMVAPDYILEIRDGGSFTEYVVSTGGDVSTYRVYGKDGNFTITCK